MTDLLLRSDALPVRVDCSAETVTFRMPPFGNIELVRSIGVSEVREALAGLLQLSDTLDAPLLINGVVVPADAMVGKPPLVQGARLTLALPTDVPAQPNELGFLEHDHLALLFDPTSPWPGTEYLDRPAGIDSSRGRLPMNNPALRVMGRRLALGPRAQMWPKNPARRRSRVRAAARTARAKVAWIAARFLRLPVRLCGLPLRDGDVIRVQSPAGALPLHKGLAGSDRYLVRAKQDSDSSGAKNYWYEYREGLPLPEVARFLRAEDSQVSGGPSHRRLMRGTILTALIPAAIGVIMAMILRQPAFLLFAVAGPLMALIQAWNSRSSQTTTPSARTTGRYPLWSVSLRNVLRTYIDPARHDHIDLSMLSLVQGSQGTGQELEAYRLTTQHHILLRLIHNDWLQIPASSHAQTSPQCSLTPAQSQALQPPIPTTIDRSAAFRQLLEIALFNALQAQCSRSSGCRHEVAFPELILDSESQPHWAWTRWLGGTVRISNSKRHTQFLLSQPSAPLSSETTSGSLIIDAPTQRLEPDELASRVRSTHARHDAAALLSVVTSSRAGLTSALATANTKTSAKLEEQVIQLIPSLQTNALDQLPLICHLSSLDLVVQAANSWASTTTKDLKFPLGMDAAQNPVWIDLVKDGPHALVAGTTGSGKSEFLQTLVTSLALRYSPDTVQFVLFDYKGGAGLGPCAVLPHCIGMVTDLDPSETERALEAIQVELRRREELLAQHNATSIDEFNAHAHKRLARIVIVLDEFRVLGDLHPQALEQLIRLAAQGRSLGMHLVLATQRPSGAISADMRANISLRICLRVSDPQDSHDVVGVALASSFPSHIPGRLCFTRGTESVDTVQAFYLDPASAQNACGSYGGQWNQLPPSVVVESQLTPAQELVKLQHTPVPRWWAPALPEVIHEHLLPASPEPVEWAHAALGVSPSHQRLTALDCSSNLFVYGPPARGKSTTVRAIAKSWLSTRGQVHWISASPDEAPSYGVNAPCTTTQTSDAFSIHALLLKLLSSHDSVQLNTSLGETRCAVIIDDYETLVSSVEGHARGETLNLLHELFRDASRLGITCVIASHKLPPHSVLSVFPTRLLLGSGTAQGKQDVALVEKVPEIGHQLGRGFITGPQQRGPIQVVHALAPTARHDHDLEHCVGSIHRVRLSSITPITPHEVFYGDEGQHLHLDSVQTLVIAGARRTGKSRFLEALSTEGPAAVFLAGKGTVTADDITTAREHCSKSRSRLIIDDFEYLDRTFPVQTAQLVEMALEQDCQIVVGVSTSAVHQSFRGPLVQLVESGVGLYLRGREPAVREMFGAPILAALDPEIYPGRATLVIEGVAYPARTWTS